MLLSSIFKMDIIYGIPYDLQGKWGIKVFAQEYFIWRGLCIIVDDLYVEINMYLRSL